MLVLLRLLALVFELFEETFRQVTFVQNELSMIRHETMILVDLMNQMGQKPIDDIDRDHCITIAVQMIFCHIFHFCICSTKIKKR